MCCVAIQTEDCQPQNLFVSSCLNLISSPVQRVVTIGQGIIIIIGNIGSLVIQFHYPCNPAERYLTVSLAQADMLMGIYLMAISYIDISHNKIFYQIVTEWTNSLTCMIFGLINFISCEMSLLIVSLLSLMRLLGIKKVGGMTAMKSKIRIVCFTSWAVISLTGTACVMLVFTQNVKIRNNMCILLGMSNHRYITPFEQIFQIFIICSNLVLLIIMIICMFCLFNIVKKSSNAIAKFDTRHEQSQNPGLIHNRRLSNIALRLLLLLVCNILTWLPFMFVSALLLGGENVHDNIQQWVVVLGLPLCASTDPILYNLAAIKSYICKAKKVRK